MSLLENSDFFQKKFLVVVNILWNIFIIDISKLFINRQVILKKRKIFKLFNDILFLLKTTQMCLIIYYYIFNLISNLMIVIIT